MHLHPALLAIFLGICSESLQCYSIFWYFVSACLFLFIHITSVLPSSSLSADDYAFQVQFETAARRQGWNNKDKVYQLVICLMGAVWRWGNMTAAEMRSYTCIVRALQFCFGRRHQPKVYRATLKNGQGSRTSPFHS